MALASSLDAVIAPALPYGSSGEHGGFAGTLSIGRDALWCTCSSSSCAPPTFPRVVFVSAHGGNAEPLAAAVRRLRDEGHDVWAWSPAWDGDAHAGRVETSLMLALAPESVGDEREPGNVEPLASLLPRLREGGVRAVSQNGVLGDPTDASARGGPRRCWPPRSPTWPRSSPTSRSPRRRAAVTSWPAAHPRSGRVTRPRSTTSSRTRLARQRSRLPLAGKARGVALVTGASRGIGRATVRRLSAEGLNVIAVDRGSDDPRLPYAMGTMADLQSLGNERVVAIPADVCDPEAMAGAVEIAERRWGGLDVLVAAAGVIAGGVPAWELDAEQERAVLEVNLYGVMVAARVGIPALLRRPQPRQGRFIAVASTAATRGLPMLAAYCASKAGVTGLTRALAVELGGTGVTANTVSPGSTRTEILDETARLYKLGRSGDLRRTSSRSSGCSSPRRSPP